MATTVRESPVLSAAHQASVYLLAVLILIQAMLAGRSLFGSWSITVHGVLGNITYTVALASVAVVVARRAGTAAVTAALALAVLLTAQIGLGYIGRESAEAAAWHIPNGVLAFGLAVYQITLKGTRK